MKNYSRLKKLVVLYRILSQLVSVLLHPLLLPTYIIILLGYFSPLSITPLNSIEGRTFLIGLIFMSTFFLPFLMLVLYIMIKDRNWTIKSFLMNESKERVFPFLIVGAFYSVLIYLGACFFNLIMNYL